MKQRYVLAGTCGVLSEETFLLHQVRLGAVCGNAESRKHAGHTSACSVFPFSHNQVEHLFVVKTELAGVGLSSLAREDRGPVAAKHITRWLV